jgi:hypothetical protein
MLCKFMGMSICNQPSESSAGNTVGLPHTPMERISAGFPTHCYELEAPIVVMGCSRFFPMEVQYRNVSHVFFACFCCFYGSIYWNYAFSLGHLRLAMASLGRWKHNSRVPAKRMLGLKDLTVTGWDSASIDINRHQHINNTKLDVSTS